MNAGKWVSIGVLLLIAIWLTAAIGNGLVMVPFIAFIVFAELGGWFTTGVESKPQQSVSNVGGRSQRLATSASTHQPGRKTEPDYSIGGGGALVLLFLLSIILLIAIALA